MRPSPKSAFILLSARALLVVSQSCPAQSCPEIHVFGARETTVSAGYGSSLALIEQIQSAYPNTTAEAIDYPACGGQDSCGGVSYADSAHDGTDSVAAAVNSFNELCPDTALILVGYSQGGQIMDNAFCGGGDPGAGITDTSIPISSAAQDQIVAAIFMGDPRYIYGLSYEVGTCLAGGFDARSSTFTCPNANKIQSYCDAEDPYCCDGDDAEHHQQYVSIYGDDAMVFIEAQLEGTDDDDGEDDDDGDDSGGCSALWGQCGGQGWTGPTCCSSGTCSYSNDWYSQCLA